MNRPAMAPETFRIFRTVSWWMPTTRAVWRIPDDSQSSLMASAILDFSSRIPLLLDTLNVLPQSRHERRLPVPFLFLNEPFFFVFSDPQCLHFNLTFPGQDVNFAC